MALSYAVPGVYYERRARAQPRPLARTDVAGFLGFEPRVLPPSTPSRLIGSPPTGHAFRTDVIAFQLPPVLLGGLRAMVPATADLLLSRDETIIPILPGGSIKYALAAAVSAAGVVDLLVVAGPASATAESPA